MYTNDEAIKTVNTVANVLCAQIPGLNHRYTEVQQATALYWAAAEAATEMEILKSGGSAYAFKAAGNGSGEDYFYMDLLSSANGGPTFINNGMKTIMDTAVTQPAVTVTPSPPAANPAIAEQFKDSKLNYDEHLMMLLSTVPNDTKLRRIQDIINFNQSAGADNPCYLDNTYAAVEVQAKVKIGMMFLNWQMFQNTNINREYGGGYTYDVNWFQMY